MGAVQAGGGWLVSQWRNELRTAAKGIIDLTSYVGGLTQARKCLSAQGGAIILTYHSVVDDRDRPWIDPAYAVDVGDFRRQVDFLVRHRNVIGLSQLEHELVQGRTPPPGTVVITFDDGYLNNVDVAAPILADVGLPATFYLATGYVNDGENQWVDTLYSAFRHRSSDELLLDGEWFDIGRRMDRGRAHSLLCRRLIAADRVERSSVLKGVLDQLLPTATAPRLTMDWDDVRRLQAMSDRFEIGAHTRDHLDLSQLPLDQARHEIACSLDDLDIVLGLRARHFSYPFGRIDDSGGRIVRELGLATAVLTEPCGVIGAGSDPFTLARLAVGPMNALFRARTTSFSPLTRRAAGRKR